MNLYKILIIGNIHSEGKNLLKDKAETKVIKNFLKKVFIKRRLRY